MYGFIAGSFEAAIVFRLFRSVSMVTVMYTVLYAVLYLAFVSGSLLLRHGQSSKVLRADLSIQALLSLFVVICFPLLGNPWILAILFASRGCSEGLYWSVRHPTILVLIPDSRRDAWALRLQVLTVILNVVLPALAGFAISRLMPDIPLISGDGTVNLLLPPGYRMVFAFAAFCALASMVAAPVIRIPPQRLELKRIVAARKTVGADPLVGGILVSAPIVLCTNVGAGILNFLILRTEFNIGLFTSWIALSSALFFALIRRVLKNKQVNRLPPVFIGIAGDTSARVLYGLAQSLPGLVGKAILDSFVVPLRGIFGDNIYRQSSERVARKAGLSLTETFVFSESLYMASRALVIVILLSALALGASQRVEILAGALLLATAPLAFCEFFFLRAMQKSDRSESA